MQKRLSSVLIIGLIFLIGCTNNPEKIGPVELTNDDILEYAQSLNSSKELMEMVGEDFILGNHNGVPVRAWFPCSDICPDYTVMVIQYNISIEECESVNGSVTTMMIPMSITAYEKDFCVPKVLTDNAIYVPKDK